MKLPEGPQTPRSLRLLQWILRPAELLEAYQQRYGDSFTVLRGRDSSPVVYLSHPQAVQRIFTADPSQLGDIGGGGKVLRLMLGDNSLLLLEGDRHRQQRQLLMPPYYGIRV